jgi:hypothetical protein
MAHTSVLSKEVPDIEVIVSTFRIRVYLLHCFYSRFRYHFGSVADYGVRHVYNRETSHVKQHQYYPNGVPRNTAILQENCIKI